MAYTTIDNPELHFQCKIWDGNNSGTGITITLDGSEDMSPDLVWVKSTDASHSHVMYDTVRTSPAKYFLKSDENIAERTAAIGSFNSDGVTFSDSDGFYNGSDSYVGWFWNANGSGTSNSDGGITSTVSVNSTSKFSIISWSGSGTNTTVGHGLGIKPKIIFVKNRQRESAWVVNVGEAVGADERSMYLHDASAMKSDAASAGGYTYNNTTSLFSIVAGSSGNSNDINASGENIIAYAFGDVQGYCKTSTYIGNGESSNGPFVWCGFKPAWVMIKGTADNLSWTIYDNKRPGYNSDNAYLLADGVDAELSDKDIDLLSNGFKPRTNNGALNTDGNTYLFMAFAESPFVNSNGIPNNGV